MTRTILELLGDQAGMKGVVAARDAEELVAMELLTVDDEGWPHVAWLGPAEVLPLDDVTLALAVWPGSRTRKNLESGRCVLQIVVNGVIHRIRLEVEGLGPVPIGDRSVEGFAGRVLEIITDDVVYANVLSGLRYRLVDSAEVLQRWEKQIGSLADVADR